MPKSDYNSKEASAENNCSNKKLLCKQSSESRLKSTAATTAYEKSKVQPEDQLEMALDVTDTQGRLLAEVDSRRHLELASAADECEKHKALLQQQLREALGSSRHDPPHRRF